MSQSPAVLAFERDRTLNVNSIESNASSMVGLFRWGPVNKLERITTNEGELVRKFGRPDLATSKYFHSALNYILYTVPLYIVRAVDDAVALNAVAENGIPLLIKNENDYDNADLTGISFVGKYPGELGNSISVSLAQSTGYDEWSYKGEFDYAPEGDEFNMVVVDEDGMITGVAGTVLERYELMTNTAGAKKTDGTSAYLKSVLEDQSNWVYLGDFSEVIFSASGSVGVYETSLSGGVDGNDEVDVDFSSAINTLADTETLDIISSFSADMPDIATTQMIDVMDSRMDAVGFASPKLTDVYNNVSAADDVVEHFNVTINKNSSYAFYTDNWKQVYDKYNDTTLWIPTSSDAAALHARVFVQNEPWESPAGLNRGQLKNIIRLAWNPNKQQRDVLYSNNVNSIVSFPGEGTVLFGDKTALRRPSAFSRINVRSLFIVLKKSITRSAKYQLFELNDPITRSIFRNAVDSYLNNVQGRRGITRYNVVCDESNNTAQVINANEFVGDIYIDPARSINVIKLNFIAVDSGVEFEEVEGVQ